MSAEFIGAIREIVQLTRNIHLISCVVLQQEQTKLSIRNVFCEQLINFIVIVDYHIGFNQVLMHIRN